MPNSQFAVETVLLPDFSFSAEAASVGADAAQKGRGSLSGGMGGAEIGSGITMHDIEELVSNAEAAALEAEGSEQAKGSGSSQEFHRLLHEGVLKWRRGLLQPARVADVGGLVNEVLKLCEMFHCRPEPMADRSKLFPICAPGSLIGSGPRGQFFVALLGSLNHLYGGGGTGRGGPTSFRVAKRLAAVVHDSGLLEELLPPMSFTDFFSCKQLDYVGDEVHVARPVVWEEVEASLPSEVGQLDIRDFVDGGVKYYIDHLEEFMIASPPDSIAKPPKVMVSDAHWSTVAHGLVARGLCRVLRRSSLFHVGGKPLLNGLFSVSKQEFIGTLEVCRLIMNLKPANALCSPMVGDTSTLPMVTNLGTMFLDPSENLCISSEDIRCFFYLFAIPEAWWRFFGFAKPAPRSLVPSDFGDEEGYLVATVLPMGWINSVALAQHIHRRVVRQCMGSLQPPLSGAQELRRDRPFSVHPHLFRVYLDNFDELQKVNKNLSEVLEGSPSRVATALREAYEREGLPRHPKKSTQQELRAEVQGAWIDGVKGTVTAKPSKVARYIALAIELLERGTATQRELQVIGGGFVYVAMFRRPLLAGLNQIWRSITEVGPQQAKQRRRLTPAVVAELARFIGLIPLSFMNLRSGFGELVTASDASTTGGGVVLSRALTPYGRAASTSLVRGELPERHDFSQVLSVGLFDGIAALRVALDCLEVPVVGHVSVEKSSEAQRVVESLFPDFFQVEDVCLIDAEMVSRWAMRFPSVGLVIVGAGPPCQGVSGLNCDRKGALRDLRSNLFVHVPRVTALIRKAFPWAQVHTLTESVASMDAKDCETMNQSFEDRPWFIDADGVALCHRPRLYWISWELQAGEGVALGYGSDGRLPIQGEVQLEAVVDSQMFLETGWSLAERQRLPTFTTSRPSSTPLKRPAGIKSCKGHELERWRSDRHRFPPYQYKDENCVSNARGDFRIPSVSEREVIMGFPLGYTIQCLPKKDHGTEKHTDCRLSLLGNSWCVPVVAWLLVKLLQPLGLVEPTSVQEVVNRLTPGWGRSLQSLLLRPPISCSTASAPCSVELVQRLCSLVSLKGEDILLQGSTDAPAKFHRLRASVPARLWRWKTVASWQWSGAPEHINVLELRAVLTTVKYRVEQLRECDVRCVHLVDSLVVLHALSRGRSSSRKMRRTLMRISAYLLSSGLQLSCGYVDTHQNPADRPSRRGVKKKWLKKPQK